MRMVFPRAVVLLALGSLIASIGIAAAGTATSAGGQAPVGSGATVNASVHSDLSPPLRSLPAAPQPPGAPAMFPAKPLPGTQAGGSDGALQSLPATATAPTQLTNFRGVGQGFTGPQGTFTVISAPPDTAGDVGPNHYVQIVNSAFAVFNKSSGAVLYGPVPTNTLWSGFGGGCESNNDGDGAAVYDPIADRWVIEQFSVTTKPYLLCVAVSQTPNPTGAYYRYAFSYGNTDFPDYPKLGVWPDGYYVTYNIFANGTTFSGAKVCALDRANMLAGLPATQQCSNTTTAYGGLLPADLDGSRLPPSGSPNYLVSLGAAANELAFWKFHVDWVTPANTTLTGPTALATAAFTEACNGGTCIPQSGTTQKLDSLADRLMYRLAYRNFGDHEALVVNHSVTAGSSVGVRWYELRPDAAHNLSIFQQGTYAPDSNYRWMGSIAMDQQGNIGLGYSLSSTLFKPSINYTGRLAGDALGTMTAGPIINGGGSQTGNLSRWGDYSAMTVDPVDDCTFWYTTEYLQSSGTFNWSTRIASFKFPGCGAAATNDFSISAAPGSLSLAQGTSGTSAVSTAVTSGAAQTVALTVGGVPVGATATLAPASVTAGSGSTLTVDAGTAAVGNYTLTVTGTATSATHSTTVALTVTSSAIVNGGFETGDASGWTASGPAVSVVSVVGRSGSYAAQAGSSSPTSGSSSLAQTFTVTPGATTLSFWYLVSCAGTVRHDWATATLRDVTTGTTTTILPKTCTNGAGWKQVAAAVVAGHTYTIKLTNRDDNRVGSATSTLFDDVTLT